MAYADVIDYVCNHYWFYKLKIKSKRFCFIHLWWFQVIIIHHYVNYTSFMESKGFNKKKLPVDTFSRIKLHGCVSMKKKIAIYILKFHMEEDQYIL